MLLLGNYNLIITMIVIIKSKQKSNKFLFNKVKWMIYNNLHFLLRKKHKKNFFASK